MAFLFSLQRMGKRQQCYALQNRILILILLLLKCHLKAAATASLVFVGGLPLYLAVLCYFK
jgi:hypothetical protein